MEGWARFEQRARQRRIERRLQTARHAIRSRQWVAARAALDELKELDLAQPELDALTLQLTRAENGARSHRGRFAVAAAAFVTVMLAASWIENTRLLPSDSTVETAPPAPVPKVLLASRDIARDLRVVARDLPVATAGRAVRETVLPNTAIIDPPPVPVPPSRPAATLRPAPESLPPPASLPAPAPLAPSVSLPSQLAPAPAPEPVFAPPVAPPLRPPVAPAPPLTPTASPSAAVLDVVPASAVVVDDATEVRALMQKYQAAYERLDAGLVHAVWPGVNEAALARAFGGLESQALTFKTCDVQLRATTANVVCTGTTRYVPKIGSREPRVETLSWNFTLRKKANDWEIETARGKVTSSTR
jgi:hypothetical protein